VFVSINNYTSNHRSRSIDSISDRSALFPALDTRNFLKVYHAQNRFISSCR